MAIADNKIKLNMITAYNNSNGDLLIDHYYNYYYSMYFYF